MIKIDCKKYAEEILDKVKKKAENGGVGELLIVTAGNDPASEVYVRGKLKDAAKCGIVANKYVAKNENSLRGAIKFGNENHSVDGIIVQLPLPKGYDEYRAVEEVARFKDVDGFREYSPFKPCTPEAIMYLLKKELGDLTGMDALVIGRGKLVGEPITKMLLKANCTVTVAHSKTKGLENKLNNYDIVICATGKANLVDLWECDARIVIDVGISTDENGKLCGDCYNFNEDVCGDMKVAMMPGGIGLLTRAILMAHVAKIDIFE